MAHNIDYNRGCDIRVHPASGMTIFMYNDEPGVFRSSHGNVVAEALAQECGFDVERLGRERNRRIKIAEISAAINEEFNTGEAEMTVVEDRDGFRLVKVGNDRYNIIDPDGNCMNPGMPLNKKTGKAIFDKTAPAKNSPASA